MIVNSWLNTFELIAQHDHGRLAGKLAQAWGDKDFLQDRQREAVIKAVYDHDKSWLPLDQQPRWDDEKQTFLSFYEYPLDEKLKAYKRGVTALEEENGYSAALVSLHYTSFLKGELPSPAAQFKSVEQRRQYRLAGNASLQAHLDLLQFCDDLSLYALLNIPGIDKAGEWPWFKHGFRQVFSFLQHQTIQAKWCNRWTIQLSPFPFSAPVDAHIDVLHVNREIASYSQEQALREAVPGQRRLRFCGSHSM
ncbi:uncharacterized protein DUF3891 [Salsuginibacillus halophilus]|uniref:Uncharacterized protein DUF3891 n=1 Tax=Salsuginibacillus halophilus TaxID=517424 RepID=A0A2P8HWE8_9BACI|nr:DUF3891 family protein [Salsuginibacillus halophilus]PSL50551.1 uncharacterized protein DUF3891 [Salsuginibacillus halophilus]